MFSALFGLHPLSDLFFFFSPQPPNLCKMDGEVAGKSWTCQGVSGMLKRGTCGTALLPKKATPRVTLGAMHLKRSHRRCEVELNSYTMVSYGKRNNFIQSFHSKLLLSMLIIFYHHVSQGKVPGKQEDAWIMNRLIKQLTEMGFPVSWSDSCCIGVSILEF